MFFSPVENKSPNETLLECIGYILWRVPWLLNFWATPVWWLQWAVSPRLQFFFLQKARCFVCKFFSRECMKLSDVFNACEMMICFQGCWDTIIQPDTCQNSCQYYWKSSNMSSAYGIDMKIQTLEDLGSFWHFFGYLVLLPISLRSQILVACSQCCP